MWIMDLDKLNLNNLVYGALVLVLAQFLLLPQLPQMILIIKKWSKVTRIYSSNFVCLNAWHTLCSWMCDRAVTILNPIFPSSFFHICHSLILWMSAHVFFCTKKRMKNNKCQVFELGEEHRVMCKNRVSIVAIIGLFLYDNILCSCLQFFSVSSWWLTYRTIRFLQK